MRNGSPAAVCGRRIVDAREKQPVFFQSNPARYVDIATKMTEGHLPAVINRTPQLPVARFVPPQPEMQITQVVRAEIPALPSIGVTVSLQHRSPPISLS